jgi:hypothetical protein
MDAIGFAFGFITTSIIMFFVEKYLRKRKLRAHLAQMERENGPESFPQEQATIEAEAGEVFDMNTETTASGTAGMDLAMVSGIAYTPEPPSITAGEGVVLVENEDGTFTAEIEKGPSTDEFKPPTNRLEAIK